MPNADPTRIEVLARGVIAAGPWVLLTRNRTHGHHYLPGGHVEPGESSPTALVRELGEETELDVARLRVGPCLLVEEQRFLQRGKPRHELNVVFHVEHGFAAAGDGPPPAVKPRESHIDFEWVHADRLDGIHLRPPVLAAWLRGVIEQGAPAGDVRPLWRSIEAEHDVHEPR